MPAAAGVEVRLRFESVSVQVPSIQLQQEQVTVRLPPDLLPNRLDLGRLRVDLGRLPLPTVSEQLRVPSISFESINLPSDITVPTVSFTPGRFSTQRVSIPTPFGQFGLEVIDPFGFQLPDVDVGFRSVNLPGFQSFPVPEPDTETVRVELGSVDLPQINEDLGSVPLPDVPTGPLTSFPLPSIQTSTSTESFPDPSTLRLEVSVDEATLADTLLPDGALAFLRDTESAVLEALTDATGVVTDLFTDTARFVYETAFTELENRVTDQTAERIKRLVEGFLQLLLSEDTKQDLREQRRE
jgi:hypothetical protein